MKNKKKLIILIICLFFITAGIFFRAYRFGDFLSFKLDQMRDTVLINNAINDGPGALSLLGPRAGGTYLRLGPIFYYFEYFAAAIVRSASPVAMAWPNLIFSVFSILLFYFLLQKYFNRQWTLILTALYSLSFLLVEYSRFAWNPNPLPFFNLLFLLSLLNVFDEKSKHPNFWSAACGAALAIATQLHFTAFLTMPVILMLFLILKRKEIRKFVTLKKLGVFLAIIAMFYLPVILSDILNRGDNFWRLIWAFNSKSSEHSLFFNFKMDFYYFGKYFMRIISGYMISNPYLRVIFAGAVAGGTVLNYLLLRHEKDSGRKNFLRLSLVWFIVIFASYVPLADEIDRPRFFLPVVFLPYIFLGYAVVYFEKIKKINLAGIALKVIVSTFFASSFFWDISYMKELSVSQEEKLDKNSSTVLKAKGEDVFWTWGIFKRAEAFVNADCLENRIMFYMPKYLSEYNKPFEYILERNHPERDINQIRNKLQASSQACYYFVSKTGDDQGYLEENSLLQKETKILGDMTIIKFYPGETYKIENFEGADANQDNSSESNDLSVSDSNMDSSDSLSLPEENISVQETAENNSQGFEAGNWQEKLQQFKEFLRKNAKKRPNRSDWSDVIKYFTT